MRAASEQECPTRFLADLRRRLEPLARADSPLSAPPPRKTRFGSPLVLSRVHWVEPRLVAEITYLTWTEDGLLRQTEPVRETAESCSGCWSTSMAGCSGC
jgi:ATP-dependent DNA ligase